MSWKDSVRKKGSRSMSSIAGKYIDEIMTDNKARTLREVMEALYELKNSQEIPNRNFSNIVPTTEELRHHFSSDIYQKAGRDEFTGKLRYKRV